MLLTRHGDLALLRFDDGKANAIDDAFLDELPRVLRDLGDARALVVTGRARIFSAGLALPTLVGRDRAAMRDFMTRFDEATLALYAAPLPVIAALNGHALAGGCVLALMCDRRLMVDNDATIGLNEVRLGIGLPAGVLEPLRAALPGPGAAQVALSGRGFAAREALALGLVDELCAPAELEATALARAATMAEAPRAGYAQIKAALRRPVLAEARRHAAAELESWLDTWFTDEAQRTLAELVAKLTKRAPQ